MSSRSIKKRVWKLKNMTNGEWLNMLRKMSPLEKIEFKDWCYIHGLGGMFHLMIENTSYRYCQ